MVIVKFKKGLFSAKDIWFCDRPRWPDFFKNVAFMQCRYINNILGFKKTDFYTKVIDLSQGEEQLLNRFKKNTRYEILRGMNEGLEMRIEDDVDSFIAFFKKFSATKDLKSASKYYLQCFKENLIITKAIHNKEVLVMHSYILDKSAKIARLLYSASLFRLRNDGNKTSAIGRANRFLHFRDMIFFKNLGITRYDLGGYAHNTADKSIKNVIKFKDCFGGELVLEPNFIPYPFLFFRKVKSLIFKRI